MNKKRILIIDDEKKVRDVYKRSIYAAGSSIFDVVDVSNAIDATEYMIREKIDVVILDIGMPEVSGQTMHEVIKQYDPTLKVIVASVFPVDVQKRMIPDALYYYDKSRGPFQLLDMVTESLVN